MKGIDIVPYDPTDHERFRASVAAAFHPAYILTDPAYVRWQFEGGHLLLARIRDEIIGHFGYRDCAYRRGEAIHTVRVLMNLFVHPQYRSVGAGALLASAACRGAEAVLVSGYNSISQQLFSKVRPGWRDAGNLNRHLCILNSRSSLLRGYRIASSVGFNSRAESHGYALDSAPTLDASFEDLWRRVGSRYGMSVERTAAYLAWRFFEHPFFSYSIIAARQNSGLAGYIVWRTEEDQGFRICRIVDCVCEPEAEQALFGAVREAAAQAGADALDFMHSGTFCGQGLRESGFFSTAGTDFERFPILFSPLSSKKLSINIGCDPAFPLDQWYLTKADGDQDRPNPH